MFKFLHAADIHLDSPLRGLSRYESAPAESVRNACRRAFENLVDLAIEEKVAFVLLSGDLYDGDWKDYSTGIFLGRQVGRLGRNGIAVFAVAGNHDAASRITAALDCPANMKVFPSQKGETFRHQALAVAIHGQSFATQHVDRNLAAGYPPAAEGMFNIGMLHTSLDGREGHDVYAPCSTDDLCRRGYQYWALGHVHAPETVSEDPWIVFPGCIQGRHIRERGPKGCVLVTVAGGAVESLERRPLDVLRWALTTVDASGASDARELTECAREAIESALEASEGRPTAMRVRCIGATAASAELAAFPERFEQRIRALAAEIAGDSLWIERVENATSDRFDHTAAPSEPGALGNLLEEIARLPDGPEAADGIRDLIADLRQKMPPEAFGPGSPLDLDEAGTARRLVAEAKRLLVGRLLAAGDAG